MYSRCSLAVSLLSIFECDCCAFMVVRVFGAELNFYMSFVYRSPSTDDGVYDCLLEYMGSYQSQVRKSAFAFLAISMGIIASSLGPRVLVHMVLPLVILLHCLDAPKWFVAPLVVWVAFWIQLHLMFMICVWC